VPPTIPRRNHRATTAHNSCMQRTPVFRCTHRPSLARHSLGSAKHSQARPAPLRKAQRASSLICARLLRGQCCVPTNVDETIKPRKKTSYFRFIWYACSSFTLTSTRMLLPTSSNARHTDNYRTTLTSCISHHASVHPGIPAAVCPASAFPDTKHPVSTTLTDATVRNTDHTDSAIHSATTKRLTYRGTWHAITECI